MSARKSEIKTLIETKGYSTSTIPTLEQYALEQCTSKSPSSYDFDANRTLMKLYQFFPNDVNATDRQKYTAAVALLTVAYGTGEQFGALNCLIPEHVKLDQSQSQESEGESALARILAVVQNMETCTYESMWSAWKTLEEGSGSSAEFAASSQAKDAMRKTIVGALGRSFKSSSVDYVLKCLDFKNQSELKGLAGVSVDGDKVVFENCEDNTKRDKGQHQENTLDYGMIRRLMSIGVDAAAE